MRSDLMTKKKSTRKKSKPVDKEKKK